MNLADYDFDPRPDASQRAAAKRRTRPVQTDKPIVWRPYAVPIGVVGCLLAAAILFTRLPSVPPMRVQPSATSATALFSAPSRTPVLPTVTKEPTARPSATQEPAQPATAAAVEATPEPATPEPPTDVPPTAWPTPRVATPTLIPNVSPIMALIKQKLDSIATPTQGAIVLTPGGCVLCHTH